MHSRAATWWTILRIALEERMVYRGDFALGTLMRFLPIVTQVFLWWAIFETVDEITGYRFEDIVVYYLLTMLARAFSSMPGLASGVALQIRNGEIKKFLIQPVDLVGFLLLNRVAHKAAYYTVAIGPFALVFFLCRWAFVDGVPDLTTFAAFIASLFMAFLLGFFLEMTIGLIGFWFLEVTSLLFVYMLLSFFLSGHMFPLDMLGEWSVVVDVLPLKYLAYFPAAVFLGKVEGPDLARELLVEAGWVLFFMIACRWMFARGVKRYSGFGG
ncbi:MAG: ABC-2 family transporter protein [Pirellulaceae bacterium]|jgi:ABC-2 type transport system permease protein|nr:ABC-2 family transporter protein [Pirellulaceae bacterium]